MQLRATQQAPRGQICSRKAERKSLPSIFEMVFWRFGLLYCVIDLKFVVVFGFEEKGFQIWFLLLKIEVC